MPVLGAFAGEDRKRYEGEAGACSWSGEEAIVEQSSHEDSNTKGERNLWRSEIIFGRHWTR